MCYYIPKYDLFGYIVVLDLFPWEVIVICKVHSVSKVSDNEIILS